VLGVASPAQKNSLPRAGKESWARTLREGRPAAGWALSFASLTGLP